MKLWSSSLVVLAALLIVACGGGDESEETEVTTISPRTPEVTEESDPDLSQTLEIGEDRSPNEGADLPGFQEEIESAEYPPPDYVEVADDGQPVPPEKDPSDPN